MTWINSRITIAKRARSVYNSCQRSGMKDSFEKAANRAPGAGFD